MATMNNEPSETRKRIVAGSTLSAGVLLAIALFAMVNFVAMRHYQRFDWTSADLYSLSEKSTNVVAGIDRDIDAIVFLSPGTPLFDQVDELLSRYEAANPRIQKRVIDAVRNRLEAEQLVERFGIERANVVVLASGDDRRVIDEMDLVEYDYATAQYGQPPTVKGFKGEQMITSAILELVEDKKPKVLFTTGHGEASIDGLGGAPGGTRTLNDAVSLLGQDNFDLESWSSLGQSAVPAETDLVVIAGPTSRFLAPELDVFTDYLDAGGRMLVMLDPAFDETGAYGDLGLTEWLSQYGVALARDIVIDPDQRLPLFGAETLFTMDYGFHPIVESLADRPVMLPLARSVSRADVVPEGWEVTELVNSSTAAWGETNLDDLENVAADGDDLTGPISLAVAVTRTDADSPEAEIDGADIDPETDETGEAGAPAAASRLVVFGDFDFASDEWVRNGANAGLLLNTLNWLIEREQLLAIEPRTPEQTKLLLGPGELGFIYLLVMVLLPGAAIVAGVFVYLRRRR